MTSEISVESPSPPDDHDPPVTAEELLRRYAAGERSFPETDLMECSFEGAVLEGAIFIHSWLCAINFRRANLRGVRFENCMLKCSDFSGADLQDASFAQSNIGLACYEGANLVGANFADAVSFQRVYREGDIPAS